MVYRMGGGEHVKTGGGNLSAPTAPYKWYPTLCIFVAPRAMVDEDERDGGGKGGGRGRRKGGERKSGALMVLKQ